MLPTLFTLATLITAAPPSSMGSMTFEITGNRACKKIFLEGMLALHSFMYDEAHAKFQTATKADPRCAMAHWGDALAYTHPLWREEETEKSRAALAAIANLAELTDKERAFIDSARILVGEGDINARFAGWEHALEKMQRDFPSDDEVALFHALSLIANSERLTKTKLLMRSAAISTEIFQRKPNHPGAAHYLIHACDTPDHAILALPAARAYAKIAPAASHALHMPSHIFVQLGMWSDVARSNEASWAASEKEAIRWAKTDDQRDWHSYSWLSAAYLELGQIKKAEQLIDALRVLVETKDGPEMRFGYAMMINAYLSQTGRWDETESRIAPLMKPLPLEAGQKEGTVACAMHAPEGGGVTRPPFGLLASVIAFQIRAEAAMRRGDEKAVKEALAGKSAVRASMTPWGKMLPKDGEERANRYEVAFVAAARARATKEKTAIENAIVALGKLVEVREAYALGPAFETPHAQLLGEFLLEFSRPREARVAFDRVLEVYPNITRALLGAAKAARAAGEDTVAKERYASLAAQWKQSDASPPPL